MIDTKEIEKIKNNLIRAIERLIKIIKKNIKN